MTTNTTELATDPIVRSIVETLTTRQVDLMRRVRDQVLPIPEVWRSALHELQEHGLVLVDTAVRLTATGHRVLAAHEATTDC